MNAYITAPIEEKVRTTLGPEFGDDTGKQALIGRTLYVLKLAGAGFRAHLGSLVLEHEPIKVRPRGCKELRDASERAMWIQLFSCEGCG